MALPTESSLFDMIRDPEFVDFFRVNARQFLYVAKLASTDPHCAQTFVQREFVHHDWVDGTDMVQAGRTPDNDGFNYLFHNLESDLDKARADITTLFHCVATLRAQVSACLAELKSEINRLDKDVWALIPNKSLITAGVQMSEFVGFTQLGGKTVAVVKAADGSLTTMSLASNVASPLDDHLLNAAELAAFAASTPALQAMFANRTATADELVARFGTQTLANGQKLSDVLGILGPTESFHSVDELVSAVATREARAGYPSRPAWTPWVTQPSGSRREGRRARLQQRSAWRGRRDACRWPARDGRSLDAAGSR
jgi:hypothetical protein